MATTLPRGRRKDARGQMLLPPFAQKPVENRPGERRRKGPSREERRATKARAYRLCMQAYAILKSRPDLLREKDIKYHRGEIGQSIGAYRKGRLTYAKAQSAIGKATAVLDKAGVKYKL